MGRIAIQEQRSDRLHMGHVFTKEDKNQLIDFVMNTRHIIDNSKHEFVHFPSECLENEHIDQPRQLSNRLYKAIDDDTIYYSIRPIIATVSDNGNRHSSRLHEGQKQSFCMVSYRSPLTNARRGGGDDDPTRVNQGKENEII